MLDLFQGVVANILDSSAPVILKGKQREVPRVKKPSPLKKVYDLFVIDFRNARRSFDCLRSSNWLAVTNYIKMIIWPRM